jgi:chromate transport protein ChrA
MLSRGRLGSVVAGLGFILPGVVLVCIISFLYDRYGLSNAIILSILQGIKCSVAACVLYACYNLGRHAFIDSKTKTFSNLMFFIGGIGALQSVLNINFFIVLGVCGTFNVLFERRLWISSVFFGCLCVLCFGLYVGLYHFPSESVLSASGLKDRNGGTLLVIGLLSGLLTFGGAYTVIPFISQTLEYAWLPARVLLDSVALTICLPAPLV